MIRQEGMNPKINPLRNTSLRNIMTKTTLLIKGESDQILRMVRTDTSAKRESHREAGVTRDRGHGKDVIEAEAGSGGSHAPEAGSGRSHALEAEKENVGSDLAPAQGQDTDIGVEAEVGQGVEVEIERRGLKSLDASVEV